MELIHLEEGRAVCYERFLGRQQGYLGRVHESGA